MKVRVTKQAAQDLREIEDYIGKDSPVAAVKFVQKLAVRFGELVDSPGIGRKRTEIFPSLRSSPVGEYLIFYRPFKGGIEIVRVIHGKRDLRQIVISD